MFHLFSWIMCFSLSDASSLISHINIGVFTIGCRKQYSHCDVRALCFMMAGVSYFFPWPCGPAWAFKQMCFIPPNLSTSCFEAAHLEINRKLEAIVYFTITKYEQTPNIEVIIQSSVLEPNVALFFGCELAIFVSLNHSKSPLLPSLAPRHQRSPAMKIVKDTISLMERQ